MKKELFAIGLLLIILVASVINVNYIKNLTNELTGYVDTSIQSAKEGKWKDAQDAANTATECWNEAKTFTHIVLKHDKIDAATEIFYDLLLEINSKNTVGTAVVGEKLKETLSNIYTMEKLRIGSIF